MNRFAQTRGFTHAERAMLGIEPCAACGSTNIRATETHRTYTRLECSGGHWWSIPHLFMRAGAGSESLTSHQNVYSMRGKSY